MKRSCLVVAIALAVLTAVPAGLRGVPVAAAATPGAPRAWGLNTSGQLGDGSTTQRNTPVQVSGLTGALTIAWR